MFLTTERLILTCLTSNHPLNMPQTLRLAVSQSHTRATTRGTLSALEIEVQNARRRCIDLILFPEAYLGGYPRTATFGSAVGARRDEGREQFLNYFKDAVDLGDTPEGAGTRWVDRELEKPDDGGVRGDGTREEVERIARENGVFVVTGVVERCGGTLYCAVIYVCPELGVLGKRRKVMPVGAHGNQSTNDSVYTDADKLFRLVVSALFGDRGSRPHSEQLRPQSEV